MIFDENIKKRTVPYVLATSVRNNDGRYYAEYGCYSDKYSIEAIFYDGYHDSKVFAYIGFPHNTYSGKVPAIVLVHGGLGKAEIDWVKKWNDIGFAAISMDLYGDGPEDDKDNPYGTGKRKHPYAGMFPWNDYGTAFLSDYENAGMYQNVYNVVSAINLLVQSDKVDEEKIGITGISWGGITTLITAGFDNRLKFAIPVYGCGFLHESRTYFHSVYERGADPAWDPSNFAAMTEMPILLINGDNDKHFSINSSSHTYEIIHKGYLSIHHGLKHSQEIGDSIKQVYHFAENIIGSSAHTFVDILDVGISGSCLQVKIKGKVKKAVLYYIVTKELGYGGENNIRWFESDFNRLSNTKIEFTIPYNATYFYVSVEDYEDNIISTKLFQKMVILDNGEKRNA